MNRRTTLIVGIGAAIIFLALPPARAQDEYDSWRFRVFAGVVCRCVESDNVTFVDPVFGTSATEIDGTGFGFGLGIERRFSKLLGVDLSIGRTELDVEFTQSLTPTVATDTLDVTPIWLALNFHVVNSDSVDFWVGPQIAYVLWSDPLKFSAPGQPTYTVKTDAEFPAIGIALGLDYWLSETGGLNFAFRFVDADADPTHNLPVDPTFITVGYTWMF